MKGNKFLKRLAVTALTATMTVGVVPATAAMTATNVFAAQNVTFEADDAASNVSGLSDSISADDQKTIKAAVEAATIADDTNSTAESPVVNFTPSALPTGYTIENFKILSATAPSMKITASGPVLVKPILHMQGDVQKDGAAKGTVTFDIEATGMTKTEKIAALKTLLTTVGGSTNDSTTYSNDDNSSSLTRYVNTIITSVKDTGDLPLTGTETGNTFDGLTISATQTSITKATKSAAGSENVKVDIKATLTKGTDKDWDDTWGTAAGSTHDVTDSASYTATISKLPTEGKDDAYQAKVTAALKNTTITNTEYATETEADATKHKATAKIKKALEAVGIADDTVSVTFRNYKKATHAADGSVEVLLDDTSRNGNDGEAVQYATVTIPVTHKDDVVEVEKEVQGVLSKVEKAIAADSKDVSSSKSGRDDQLKDLKANIQKKVDEALAATDGGNSYASEIKKVEVSLDKAEAKYTAAGTTMGTIAANGLVFTVTYNDEVGTPTSDTAKGISATKDASDSTKVAYKNIDAINVYKVDAVDATSMTLPETSYVQTKATAGTTITPKFTPENTNAYTIRWDLKDTKTVTFATSQNNAATVGTTGVTLSGTSLATDTEVFTQNGGVKVVPVATAKAGDSVELTASLLDKEGLVIATVKTNVTLLDGFVDVQNKYDYAYNAITNMSKPQIVIKNGKAEKVAVISGVGDNKFDPDADVTRAQFVTFLYRLAQWESAKVQATADNVNPDANINADALKTTKDGATDFDYFPSFTDAKAQTKFTDVAAGAYYAKAVDWAVANGIAAGKTATTFDPNAVVTRAEAVTFLQRYYAAGQKYNVSSKFADVKSTDFFANAVGWATSIGVTQGKDDTHFAPKDTCSRKEAAAFIFRANRSANIYK